MSIACGKKRRVGKADGNWGSVIPTAWGSWRKIGKVEMGMEGGEIGGKGGGEGGGGGGGGGNEFG